MSEQAESPEPTEQTIWDQFPNETAVEYQLFAFYRELGLGRNLRAVERAYRGAYTYAWIHARAQYWSWDARAEAFDNWLAADRDRRINAIRDSHADRWARDQIELAELATQVVRQELLALIKRQEAGERIPVSALATISRDLHKHQNLATGKSTEIVDNRIDLDQLTEEQRAKLESVRAELEILAKR